MHRFRRLLLLLSALFAALSPLCAQADEKLWGLLRGGGQVIYMRHAQTTPGSGDPAGYRVDDCSTQRNLSGDGREQARRIGEALRARGVPIGEVLTSRWCRCVDTAQLAFNRHQVWSEINSLFDNPAAREKQVSAVRKRVAAHHGRDNLVLVSHGSNILPLTGIHPSQGGMVILTPGGPDGFRIAGRLEPEEILSRPAASR